MQSISSFALWVVTNPVYCLGALLALMAMIGFLVFLRGFFLGIPQLFYISVHDEHLEHARVRTVYGMLIMFNAFVAWVVIRIGLTFLGQDTANMPLSFGVIFLYIALYLFAKYMGFFPKKGGH